MKLIFSHPTGNANVRAAGIGLLNANVLSGFHTAIACFPGGLMDRVASLNSFSEIRRRRFDLSLKPHTVTVPWREAGRLLVSKTGLKKLLTQETGWFSIDAVYQDLDKHVASMLKNSSKKGVNAVYAYEDGALFSFRVAKHLGLKCLYDLPIGYWRSSHRLLESERERWPEWASTLIGFNDSDLKLKNKDEELKLADRIFVASQFTAKSLDEFPGKLAPIEVIPYGFPEVGPPRTYQNISDRHPLKLLFVGGLSQRKGIANLFAAVKSLGRHVQLTIVGKKVTNDCSALNLALANHRWIPALPNNQILELMRQHDVLVFPSLFEGFGLVISEAMSQGTPVITTDRTAGPDLILHDKNGWLIEAGSTEALKNSIERLLIRRSLIAENGIEARKTALARPWFMYGSDLADCVLNLKT